ncbi:hypothetical protein [uncultured Bacteroides sp.]|uniref:hypothetical protein n=1 Tax=uncultured Bacteroides sp. TaxID=162156 RepID=UPI0025E40B87|nr:hypothetical protein [uncultured Bacteroides sp.]
MKTNVQLKGLLMLCVVIGIIIVYVNFQHSKIGTVLLIASVVLSFIAAYYIDDNTNDKQFERIMKKVVAIIFFISLTEVQLLKWSL